MEDAFFHEYPAPPDSEKLTTSARRPEESARERAGIRGTPQKGLRFADATIDLQRSPIIILVRE
ncbi:MAG: hypothetical protein L3J78_02885 [Thermoplasmata archaeon]|nr:hypothetical protein [Thermoplasmata archaeon]